MVCLVTRMRLTLDYVNRRVARKAVRAVYASTAVLGYILSPLSWWNDLLVNIPIALLAANVIHSVMGVSRELLFIAVYWLTNVVGLILMVAAGEGAVRGRVTFKGLALSVIVSLAYTILAVYVLSIL